MPRTAGGRIRWLDLSLLPNLFTFVEVFNAAVAHKVREFAQEVEDYAQENAPWEDQTGAAREGLTATALSDGGHHAIVLYHTVDYGIWLEIRWSGQYAIILPTIEAMGPKLMDELQITAVMATGASVAIGIGSRIV